MDLLESLEVAAWSCSLGISYNSEASKYRIEYSKNSVLCKCHPAQGRDHGVCGCGSETSFSVTFIVAFKTF